MGGPGACQRVRMIEMPVTIFTFYEASFGPLWFWFDGGPTHFIL
jgi:hypothetical protein